MGINSFFDIIFAPILNLPPFWAIVILSLFISLVIILIYKYTTNQNLMRQLKDEIKELQKEVKELKSNPQEAMKVQKRMMDTNIKYMTHSLKPTLITFIPIILIFGWMSANFAYEPIKPLEDFTMSVFFSEPNGEIEISAPPQVKVKEDTKKEAKDKVSWTLKGEKGEHLIEFNYNGEKHSTSILIDNIKYSEPVKKIKNSNIKTIVAEHKKKIVFNLFGWEIGWLGTYIIFSIIFSILLRKVMKIY